MTDTESKHEGGYYASTRRAGERLIAGTVEITVLGFSSMGKVIIGIRNAGPKIDIKRLPPSPDWKEQRNR